MKRQLMIGPAVWAEIQCARAWYEERAAGLGSQFARAVDAAFAAIERDPGLGAKFDGTVHRRRLRRFPYSVFYTYDDERIWLIAVFHASRDPEVLLADCAISSRISERHPHQAVLAVVLMAGLWHSKAATLNFEF